MVAENVCPLFIIKLPTAVRQLITYPDNLLLAKLVVSHLGSLQPHASYLLVAVNM